MSLKKTEPGLTQDTQRYAWPFSVVDHGRSSELYFETKGPPCSWIILVFYKTTTLVVGFEGVILTLSAQLYGTDDRARFNMGSGQAPVPGVGAMYTCVGKTVYFFLDANSIFFNNVHQGNVWGIPLIEGQSALFPDTEKVPVDPGIFGVIPQYAVGIAADPPGQTIQILDVAGVLVQTIVLGSQADFSPMDARGFFMQNTLVVATLFWFKRKTI